MRDGQPLTTGRLHEADYLTALGAANIVDRATLSSPGRPLQSERWAGVVDAVGSHTLANACAATRWNSAVAACGLAQGSDFPASVMPHPAWRHALRHQLRLHPQRAPRRGMDAARRARATRPPDLLDRMTSEVALSDIVAASRDLLEGRLRGRAVVDVNR